MELQESDEGLNTFAFTLNTNVRPKTDGEKKVRRKRRKGDEEERLWELEQQDRDCGVSQEARAWRLRECWQS